MNNQNGTISVRVTRIECLTPEIKRFTLIDPEDKHLPAFSGGSHVVVVIQDGDKTYRNAYSLMSSPYDSSAYQIAVRRAPESRGGSQWLHDKVCEGDLLEIMHPANLFPLAKHARHHLFIAGGVGITPVYSQLEELQLKQASFELHLAVRGPEHSALGLELQARYGKRVHLYIQGQDGPMDIHDLLAERPLGSHVYVCGPDGMIEQTIERAHDLGWTNSHIHFERFVEQGSTGQPFSVTLARQGVTIEVPSEQSLLEAAEQAGYKLPYLCRGGACGYCEANVLEIEGELDHRDDWLSEEDKLSKRKFMPCVSRANCSRLVVDL
ncbi:oxidoreductase [Halomonas sp. ISL-60]|uniref:PDR/VanB family oxidoreductase n=1 Tax=Halomonas sp. ISL-56 TaxID=2819149 RepID=UPI001BE60361|nr:PDR/VanB family oxidoreductase [Halomonas sp. ISL-56]MBT2771055.1 oxidoreductase [Halomonas sp. ISL-60]MBT2801948.1 oxidoreductase [Halomonas sp. ISL-56]